MEGRTGLTSDLARVDMGEWIRTHLWSKVLECSPGGMVVELAKSRAHFTASFNINIISFKLLFLKYILKMDNGKSSFALLYETTHSRYPT